MPKGPRGEKRPADTIGCAVKVARIATGEIEDDGYATPGRKKSGVAGAAARKANLGAGRRSEIAKAAADARWQKRRSVMAESGMERLQSVLFNEGRDLVNIKFIPGSNRGLTPDQLGEAASVALKSVFSKDLVDKPPSSGRPKASLKATFAIEK
jgi:hypothetical protein